MEGQNVQQTESAIEAYRKEHYDSIVANNAKKVSSLLFDWNALPGLLKFLQYACKQLPCAAWSFTANSSWSYSCEQRSYTDTRQHRLFAKVLNAHAASSRCVSCRHPCVSRNDGLDAPQTVQSQQLGQHQAVADGTLLKLYMHTLSLPASMHPVIDVTCSA